MPAGDQRPTQQPSNCPSFSRPRVASPSQNNHTPDAMPGPRTAPETRLTAPLTPIRVSSTRLEVRAPNRPATTCAHRTTPVVLPGWLGSPTLSAYLTINILVLLRFYTART